MGLASIIDWSDRAAGDIGALHGTDALVSPAIIEGEKLAGEVAPGAFEASHIFIVGVANIFEAVWPKISLSPWHVYDGARTQLYRLNVPDAGKIYALLEVQSRWLGQHYDLFGVLGMGMLEIDRFLTGHNVDVNAFASSHKAWCSELGTDYLERLPIGDIAVPQATDPQQLVNFLNGLCDVDGGRTGTATG